MKISNLESFIIHALLIVINHLIELFGCHLAPHVFKILFNGIRENIIVGVSYNGEKIVFTDVIVAVHVIQIEGNLFKRDNVVQKVLALGTDSTVHDDAIELLIKVFVIQLVTPVKQGANLIRQSFIVSF